MLVDASVSRFHAALVRNPKGVWVVDMQARDGVLVNGIRLRWAWLEDGDTVRIGQFAFILRYQTAPGYISRRDVPLEAGALPPHSSPDVHRGKSATTLAVRSRNPESTPASIVRATSALTPDVLVPEKADQWERGTALPPEQLAMWQQQMRMMESFHQDMILMVQMFMAMHREHRVTIREELERVQKLTKKLSILQEQLTQAEGSAPDNRSLGAVPRTKKLVEPKRSRTDGRQPEQGEKPPTQSRPAQPREVRRPAPSGSQNKPGTDRSQRTGRSANQPENHAELHSQLTQRITELQRERQTYWQRILSSINK
jgi:hypothetical protein